MAAAFVVTMAGVAAAAATTTTVAAAAAMVVASCNRRCSDKSKSTAGAEGVVASLPRPPAVCAIILFIANV